MAATAREKGFMEWFDQNVPVFQAIIKNKLASSYIAAFNDTVENNITLLSPLNDHVFLASMTVDLKKNQAIVLKVIGSGIEKLKDIVSSHIYDTTSESFNNGRKDVIHTAWVMKFEGAVKVQPFDFGMVDSITEEECIRRNKDLFEKLVYKFPVN